MPVLFVMNAEIKITLKSQLNNIQIFFTVLGKRESQYLRLYKVNKSYLKSILHSCSRMNEWMNEVNL